MVHMTTELITLQTGTRATVVGFTGPQGFAWKLRTIGIREGKTLTVVARHPFGGPVVVSVDGRAVTLGRGMARRVLVDVQA